MRKKPLLSLCIPLFNEEKTVLSSLKKLDSGLKTIVGSGNYEILLAENGSTDNTFEIIEKINNPLIKRFKIPQRGQGGAYRACINKAIGEYILLSAIDLPFGFDDLKQALKIKNKYDFIFGSKSHSDSKITVLPSRRISSFIFNFLLRRLFFVKVKDTQGTIFGKRSTFLKIIPKCTAQNAFFTAQVAIWAEKEHFSSIEVPVIYNSLKKGARKSKYNIVIDGGKMLFTLIQELITTRF